MVVANSLVQESLVLAAVHVGQGSFFSVNLRQDKCYSLFCNFISPYEWKVTTLKVRHESSLSGIFQAVSNTL